MNDVLSQTGPYTIFAPTNDAFKRLPEGSLTALQLPENKALLKQLLSNHIVKGKKTAADLKTGRLQSLGGSLAVRVGPNGTTINDASVLQPDIAASNGEIHAISAVLLNPQLRAQLQQRIRSVENVKP